jgi:hypothetical protein
MANNIVSNPIVLDTIANVLTGKLISIYSVQWVNPTNIGSTAILTDDYNNIIFKATCVIANQSLIKYFKPGFSFVGLKLIDLTTGELHILTSYIANVEGRTKPYKD